ncbi:hypothetical protein SAMN05421504_11824 [Amycolatopsis xylanica]|uniref:Uncharacterized protein n=1 Tax=Amycolatopsis xylanica TaxID=589385 RepID=A0A1H3T6F4_9PSEU|nr:hypothetical protein [Amycolatopsis xylanica]SDZ45630.1 hypothetical protein SAMN05421504_11824 [Amycolatopsis xylanica]
MSIASASKPLLHPKALGVTGAALTAGSLVTLAFELSITVSAYTALALFLVTVAVVSLRLAHGKVDSILHEELDHAE